MRWHCIRTQEVSPERRNGKGEILIFRSLQQEIIVVAGTYSRIKKPRPTHPTTTSNDPSATRAPLRITVRTCRPG
jgi:hypothetical protein